MTKWRWSAPAEKLITTNCQKNFSKFKLVLHVPAKKFKEIVKINIDPHKILDNFCLMKNYLEECLSHHSVDSLYFWILKWNHLVKLIIPFSNAEFAKTPFLRGKTKAFILNLFMVRLKNFCAIFALQFFQGTMYLIGI